MSESLLSSSEVLLFGRVMTDLAITKSPKKGDPTPPRLGANNFLEKQLHDKDATLARIYAFSFEGYFYPMVKPAIFLVHGSGESPSGDWKDEWKAGFAG